jgi:hypothetical protein
LPVAKQEALMRRFWSWRALGAAFGIVFFLLHGTHKLLDAFETSDSFTSFVGSPTALFGMGLLLLAFVGLWGVLQE